MIAINHAVSAGGKKTPNVNFAADLLSFKDKHQHAARLKGPALDEYLEESFQLHGDDGERVVNIDTLPPSIRRFIDLQHRIAGRSTGRSGFDSFFPEDHDAIFGPETEKQRKKRTNREWWFRWLLESMKIYVALFEDTLKIKVTAKEAIKEAYKEIESELKENKEAHKELNVLIQKNKIPASAVKKIRNVLQHGEESLKREKQHLKKYEKEIIEPIEKELEGNKPPPPTELARMQRKMTYSMPIRAWHIFRKAINSMKNSFNTFPRLSNSYERETPEPAPPQPDLWPEPKSVYTSNSPENSRTSESSDDIHDFDDGPDNNDSSKENTAKKKKNVPEDPDVVLD